MGREGCGKGKARARSVHGLSDEQHGAREAGEQVGWEQRGSQCLILGGLVEETLGSHGWVFVGLVTAVQGAPEPGFCFYVKREVRSAAERPGEQGVEEEHGEKKHSTVSAESEKEISRTACWDCRAALRALCRLWSFKKLLIYFCLCWICTAAQAFL